MLAGTGPERQTHLPRDIFHFVCSDGDQQYNMDIVELCRILTCDLWECECGGSTTAHRSHEIFIVWDETACERFREQ